MGSCILAIDQGTTGTTVLAIDARGTVRSRGYAELPQHFPKPGWVEHDGEEIWSSVLRATAAALRGTRIPARSIAAIGITNQRETTLLWKRSTGKPTGRAIVWQDRRTADRCAALRRAGLEARSAPSHRPVLDPTSPARSRMDAADVRARAATRSAASWHSERGCVAVVEADGGRCTPPIPPNASRTLLFGCVHAAGTIACSSCSACRAPCCPKWSLERSVGSTRGVRAFPTAFRSRASPGTSKAALFGQGCCAAGHRRTPTAPVASVFHNGDRRCVAVRAHHHHRVRARR